MHATSHLLSSWTRLPQIAPSHRTALKWADREPTGRLDQRACDPILSAPCYAVFREVVAMTRRRDDTSSTALVQALYVLVDDHFARASRKDEETAREDLEASIRRNSFVCGPSRRALATRIFASSRQERHASRQHMSERRARPSRAALAPLRRDGAPAHSTVASSPLGTTAGVTLSSRRQPLNHDPRFNRTPRLARPGQRGSNGTAPSSSSWPSM
jgi:hypothetical protein